MPATLRISVLFLSSQMFISGQYTLRINASDDGQRTAVVAHETLPPRTSNINGDVLVTVMDSISRG
jgi:hypothetical protein